MSDQLISNSSDNESPLLFDLHWRKSRFCRHFVAFHYWYRIQLTVRNFDLMKKQSMQYTNFFSDFIPWCFYACIITDYIKCDWMYITLILLSHRKKWERNDFYIIFFPIFEFFFYAIQLIRNFLNYMMIYVAV